MAQAQFPQVPDLDLTTDKFIGDGQASKAFGSYSVANPHPGYGKDPNILNEYGHTKYPMWVKDKTGIDKIANNAEEEASIKGEETQLKQDGPTIAEWIKAGYKANEYPPKGYASKSSKEEIDAAIKASTGWK